MWYPNASTIDFSIVSKLGLPGFGFVYRAQTTLNSLLMARANQVYFVGIESSERLCRTYNIEAESIYGYFLANFKPC